MVAMRRKAIFYGALLLLLACGLGLTLAFWAWQRDGRAVEELLAGIEPGMESSEVVAILGKPTGTESFTKKNSYDGPPSMRPGLWDQVPLGTTVIHWYFPGRQGVGVVAFNTADMRVIAKWYLPRNRPVSYG
jgi:hypothetical protein